MVCSGRVELLVADGRGESDNLNAVGELEVLFGDGTGSNTAWTMSVGDEKRRIGIDGPIVSRALLLPPPLLALTPYFSR